MTLQEELLERASQEISQSIDREILDSLMIDTLLSKGWTETLIIPATGVSPALFDWYTDTAEWIHLNATGDYKLLKGRWFFENPKDATMFVLRWS